MGFVQLWCSDISYTVFHAHWRNPIIRTNSTIIPGFFEYMGIAISNIIPFFRWSLHVIPWNLHYPMTIPWLSHDYPMIIPMFLILHWTKNEHGGSYLDIYILYIYIYLYLEIIFISILIHPFFGNTRCIGSFIGIMLVIPISGRYGRVATLGFSRIWCPSPCTPQWSSAMLSSALVMARRASSGYDFFFFFKYNMFAPTRTLLHTYNRHDHDHDHHHDDDHHQLITSW